MSESDWAFDSNTVDEAALLDVHCMDITPMAASARSAVSTPGSRQLDLPLQFTGKSTASASSTGASTAPARLEPAARDCSPASAQAASAGTGSRPQVAAATNSSSNSTRRSSSSAGSVPLFDVHSGLRAAASGLSAGGDRRASSDGAAGDGGEDGLATVPPHRLLVQLQLCLRYAFGDTVTADHVVQEAPPPHRLMSQVRTMTKQEYDMWVDQVERAWYGKLRAMPPWSRRTESRRAGAETMAAAAGAASPSQPSVGTKPYAGSPSAQRDAAMPLQQQQRQQQQRPQRSAPRLMFPGASPAASAASAVYAANAAHIQRAYDVYGAQGPAGAYGMQGPVGPCGMQGPAGSYGMQGPVGPVGPYGMQGLASAYGMQGLAGAYGMQGLAGAYGMQAYYLQQPAGSPMQHVVIGPAQPTAMGPMHPIMVGRSPMAAAQFASSHGSVLVGPPMMGAFGNPYAMAGGMFYHSEGDNAGGLAIGREGTGNR